VIVRVAVKTEEPLELSPSGEIVQLVPADWVTQDRLMLVVGNPPPGVIVIVDVPDCPGAGMISEVGFAVRLKSALVIATAAEADPA
jgi:hypothetical protein